MDLYKLKRHFLEHCEIEKGQSLLTIENYDRYLSRFLTWLQNKSQNLEFKFQNVTKNSESNNSINESTDQKINKLTIKPSDITAEAVTEYRLYINRLKGSDGKEFRATTQNHHILALRAFLRYLAFRGVKSLSPEKISLAKAGERKVSFLNKEEIERLFSAPDRGKIKGVKDLAIMMLIFSTGMRVSELCSLDISDINFERGEIAVLGKGKKVRVTFVSKQAMEAVIEYLRRRGTIQIITKSQITNSKPAYRPGRQIQNLNEEIQNKIVIKEECKNQPLFLSARGKRITPRMLQKMLEKYSKIAGITKQVSPHTLRHTFATDLLSAGADLRSVQSLLGHSNISTTQVYTHVTDRYLREVHRKFHNKKEERSQNDLTDDHGNK